MAKTVVTVRKGNRQVNTGTFSPDQLITSAIADAKRGRFDSLTAKLSQLADSVFGKPAQPQTKDLGVAVTDKVRVRRVSNTNGYDAQAAMTDYGRMSQKTQSKFWRSNFADNGTYLTTGKGLYCQKILLAGGGDIDQLAKAAAADPQSPYYGDYAAARVKFAAHGPFVVVCSAVRGDNLYTCTKGQHVSMQWLGDGPGY